MKKPSLVLLLCLAPMLSVFASDTVSQADKPVDFIKPVLLEPKKSVGQKTNLPQKNIAHAPSDARTSQEQTSSDTPKRVHMRLPSVNERIKIREKKKQLESVSPAQ